MLLKEIARAILFWIKRKPYNVWVNNSVAELSIIQRNSNKEYFYGYYDHCPERNGKLLFHEMGEGVVRIILRDLSSGKEDEVGSSKAYNWQMGARALWIDDDTVSWNDFENGEYVCNWFSLSKKEIIRTFPMPVMDYDYAGMKYALAPSFQRLKSVNFEYAYSCLPEMNDVDFYDYKRDGVWIYDLQKNEKRLLLSLADVIGCESPNLRKGGKHCVNHLMISPDGKRFIFIHRYLLNCKRFDRLMYYDFNKLYCLLDDPCQSHFCWIDDHTIMGYGTYEGRKGFYEIDLNTLIISKMEELTKAHPKDGHPTPCGDWIVIDCYPDLSRMQVLIAYNRQTKQIIRIAELFHDLRHRLYNRCDLHPRITELGNRVYVDSIYSGKRQLLSIDLNI